MLEDLKLLVEVQEIDLKIHAIKKDREKLPVLVARAGEALAAAEAEAGAAKQAHDAAAKEKRTVETELKDESGRLTKMKLRSSEIKTNKEYYAHLKEIEDCQKKITTFEDRSLELMEQVEKTEAELKQYTQKTAEEKKSFEGEKTRIEAGFADGDAKLKELKQKRKAILPKISRTTAEHYAHLLTRYPDSAVVEAAGGSCNGCRMMLPPQAYNNVRKGETIIMCNNCNRILYYKDPGPVL